jgi:hypothetical protein
MNTARHVAARMAEEMDPLRGPFGNRRPTSRLSRSVPGGICHERAPLVLGITRSGVPVALKWRGCCALLSMCFYLKSSAYLITKNSSSEPSRPAPFAFSTVVVVAAGGGGIPVVRRAGQLKGNEAVIDKVRCSALLATDLGKKRRPT